LVRQKDFLAEMLTSLLKIKKVGGNNEQLLVVDGEIGQFHQRLECQFEQRQHEQQR